MPPRPSPAPLNPAELADLDLEGLRKAWRARFGDPPTVRSVELLRHCLAWRLQVPVHGGLDAGLRRRLRQGPTAAAAPSLAEGARLLREWGGELHQVDRSAAGYDWRGRTYSSLSAVAEAITGVKRNGPRFFGLRQGGAS